MCHLRVAHAFYSVHSASVCPRLRRIACGLVHTRIREPPPPNGRTIETAGVLNRTCVTLP